MMKRTAFKRSTPKKRTGHDKTMLTACKGELCYLRIPGVCIGGIDTVVPAHSNQNRHGKGMGIKADDQYSVPACFACHAEIDQGNQFSKEEKFSYWDSAFEAWEPVREMKLAAKTNPATLAGVPGLSIASI